MATSDGEDLRKQPTFALKDAEFIAQKHYGIEGKASALPSERDQNFQIDSAARSYVLKIANPDTDIAILELENQAIRLAEAVDGLNSAPLFKSLDGQTIIQLGDGKDETWYVRCLGYVPGTPLAKISDPTSALLEQVGGTLARLDQALKTLNQSRAAKRILKWDLTRAPEIVRQSIPKIAEPELQALLQTHLDRFYEIESRVAELPESVIHNDPNDYNILVDSENESQTFGLIDFGDMVFSKSINDLAICLAYVILNKPNPLKDACSVVTGYNQVRRISEPEVSVLYQLMCMRLAQSVCIANEQKLLQPENEYLAVTERPAWSMLERLATIEPASARMQFSDACYAHSQDPDDAIPADGSGSLNSKQILDLRNRRLGPSLSLSYDRPLHIVRGRGQYLFDTSDLTYLDCVNNVCHVGHCHPKVIEAATQQMGRLNTNTRYLHENIVQLAEKLTATLPEPLEVCFFVNSGSEANDLALRLARNYTRNQDVVVIDHAYHGHVSSLIEISPYKFNHAGGSGKPDHVHVVPIPDGFRGAFKTDDPECGIKYAQVARSVIESALAEGRQIGVFFAESMLGCGGQVPLPSGYLSELYPFIREQGGVCVADEVQVGFGRVGTHFWGFQQQDVVPEIVTMGKPMGNGHPLAAVVTTREIASAFDNGMEYFNTFGGNPVSCAIGYAVLNVIEKQELQEHAKELGDWLIKHLQKLAEKHTLIGDVRGSGLFLGIELVTDRQTLEPATDVANAVINQMREHCILLSTDGPHENVIKFKPPMVFTKADAERLVMVLDQVLKNEV